MLHTSEISLATKKKRKKLFTRADISGWLLIAPSFILMCVLIIRPQIMGMVWSTFEMKGFQVVEFVGLDNFKRVLTNTDFLQTFINTWEYLGWSLVIGLLPPFIIAIVMNEMAFFRKSIRTLVYFPGIMPAVAVSVLWTFIYQPDTSGLLNTVLAKIGVEPYGWLQDGRFTILYIIISMTWSGMGATAIYYFAGLQGVNNELYEAAMIDGAGFFTRLRVVVLPYMLPMLLVFAARQCLGVFQVVNQPLQMTGGGPNNASMSLGLLSYNYAFVNYKPQFAMVVNVITFCVIMIFTLIYSYVDKRASENM